MKKDHYLCRQAIVFHPDGFLQVLQQCSSGLHSLFSVVHKGESQTAINNTFHTDCKVFNFFFNQMCSISTPSMLPLIWGKVMNPHIITGDYVFEEL
jgi:hypothetical protein